MKPLPVVEVRNARSGSSLGGRIEIADRWWTRLRGLLGRSRLEEGGGLIITDSQGVHMWWMKFPLDVAMLDGERRVIALYLDLQPGKRTKMHRKARYALEVPVGVLEATGTREGDPLEWHRAG